MSITFNALESSAYEVLAILKAFPEYSETKIAIIGGTAVWKYFRNYRTTDVCNLTLCAEICRALN